ncbi:MAG: response regulator [Salibacteraceae bacterium]|jgi:response regulator RpfG family c-di-GMP phosphodiesterase|nr:response regulator [Salibacteraceae bacterium]MDP4688074.1 response regulator [Salibacteraceae bacterium]MDP4844169.1 response regulator [Salibacteraceae bacterium]MDP4963575.1 response regulator [Salibacteraceae bacterium]
METNHNDISNQVNVLYVDDEQTNLFSFKASFRRDFNVLTANSGEEALKLMETSTIHVIVSDQRMPGMTGIELLQQVKVKYPEPIRILLTGYADINAVIDAINKGEVYRYVTKPWNTDELKTIIIAADEIFKLRKENKALTDKLIKANEQLEFLLRQNMLS